MTVKREDHFWANFFFHCRFGGLYEIGGKITKSKSAMIFHWTVTIKYLVR